MENNKFKKYVIIALIIAIFIMSSAYALLYRNLMINGNASVVASWKVGITGIKEGTKVGNAFSSSIPKYTISTATFDAELSSIDDSIEYIVTLKNSGKIDANLNDITTVQSGNSAIVYEIIGVNKGAVLKAGQSIDVTIKVSVDKNATIVEEKLESSITIVFNYIQNV